MPPEQVTMRPRTRRPAATERPTWKEYYVYTADFVGAKVLAAAPAANAPPVGAGAPAFQDFEIRIDSDSDFEIVKLIYTATDPRVYARFQDQTAGRYLHRGSLDLRNNAGLGINTSVGGLGGPTETQAFLPFVWPQPHVVAAATVFDVQAADFSGAANTVRLAFHGNKIRPGHPPWMFDANGNPKRYGRKLWFTYPVPPDASVTSTGLPANASGVPFSAPVDMEADFICYKVTAQFQGPLTVSIQDGSGRDRAWMNSAIHIQNFAGNGQFPNNFTAPRFIARGSLLQIIANELSGAANRFRMFFHGVKLYEV